MSDYAMNPDDLKNAATALIGVRDNMSKVELDECRASVDTGSDMVSAALSEFARTYTSRLRATTDWMNLIALAVELTARSAEDAEDVNANIFGEIRAKLREEGGRHAERFSYEVPESSWRRSGPRGVLRRADTARQRHRHAQACSDIGDWAGLGMDGESTRCLR